MISPSFKRKLCHGDFTMNFIYPFIVAFGLAGSLLLTPCAIAKAVTEQAPNCSMRKLKLLRVHLVTLADLFRSCREFKGQHPRLFRSPDPGTTGKISVAAHSCLPPKSMGISNFARDSRLFKWSRFQRISRIIEISEFWKVLICGRLEGKACRLLSDATSPTDHYNCQNESQERVSYRPQ